MILPPLVFPDENQLVSDRFHVGQNMAQDFAIPRHPPKWSRAIYSWYSEVRFIKSIPTLANVGNMTLCLMAKFYIILLLCCIILSFIIQSVIMLSLILLSAL